MEKTAEVQRLEEALRRMAQLVPETCRYHGVRLDAERPSFGRASCCDAGRPAYLRREILRRVGVRA